MSATSVATVVASAGGHPHLAEPQAAQEMPVVQAQVTAALPAASAGLDAADVPSAVVQQRAQEKAPDFIPLEPVIVNVAGSSSGSNNAAAVATKTGKRKDKVKCFRCGFTGHISFDCTTVLCDYCESAEHVSSVYPLLLAPKPQVVMHGVC